MPLIDTYGWQFKMDVEHMSTAERSLFKRLRDAGAISAFKMALCVACGADVIKGKVYCSITCREKTEAEKNNKENGHG